MSSRADRLQRLLAIRKLSEDMDRRTLKLALASLSEVEAGLRRQQSAVMQSKSAARAALSAGDRGEWLMADAQSEVAGWNSGRLRPLLLARTSVASAATHQFLESRREHEMVKQIVEDVQSLVRIDEDRKAQAASDDWFLSRRTRRPS